jgi:signal transduction histidine kinase
MQQKVAQIRPNLEQHLTQAISTSKSSQAALVSLSETIGKTFHAEGCVILPQPSSSTTFPYWLASGFRDGQLRDHLLDLLAHLVNETDWIDQEFLAIANLQAIAPGYDLQPDLRSKSILIVSTQFQGQVNGVIALVQSQPYVWTEADVAMIQSVAPQVAIAISQAHLEHQLQQQVNYQALIDQLTNAIRNEWDLEEIFRLAVEGTASALEANRGMLLLFKYADPLHKSRKLEGVPKTKANVSAEWSRLENANTATPLNSPFWASDCYICQQVLTSKLNPVIIPAGETLEAGNAGIPDTGQAIAPIFNLQPSDALLLVPLENQGTVLGCLVLQQARPRQWSAQELSFVKLAAAQISTAIIQTLTLKQIQSVVQERTSQLQRSLEVQARLYEKSRQQVEQLRRLNAEREEFLSTISHELRTPLTSMTLAIRMLREANLPADRQSKYLDILEQQCAQETNLINDLLALRKLEANPTHSSLQKVDIRYLIQGAAQSVEASWSDRNLNLSLNLPEDAVTIYTDPDSLNRILLELLSNARKYSEPGSTVELNLAYDSRSRQAVLSLCNRGDGILPEVLPHIFDKFRRGDGVTQRAIQGTGLGLALVKGLVEHLNGTIAVTSQPQTVGSLWETCFTLTLPQSPEGIV